MADYYDAIYSKLVNYQKEFHRIEKIFSKHHKQTIRSVLDVACGTGNYSFLFARKGYRTTGIDLSNSMIEVAKRKAGERPNPQFYSMDMRHIKLKETFDVATVLFGGFGYLLSKRDVLLFFASVKERLSGKGLLLFEFWHDSAVSPASSSPSGNVTWDQVQDGQTLIVRLNKGKYDPETNILNVDFSYYVLNLENKKLADSFIESHYLKTYSVPEIRDLLEDGGLKVLGFYDIDLSRSSTLESPQQSTFRVMAVATLSAR